MTTAQVNLKHGDCPQCDGCGYVANNRNITPWSRWLKLPPESPDAAFPETAKPVRCGACSATGEGGKERREAALVLRHDEMIAVPRRAVVVFGSSSLGVAVLYATKEVIADSDRYHGYDLFDPMDPGVPEHGIWVWEGRIAGDPDPLTREAYLDAEFEYRGEYRPPTDEEWIAIRGNRSPFYEPEAGPRETFKVLTDEAKAKGRWWVSWCGKDGTFELHLPWWISGTRQVSGSGDEWESIFCAAVLADSEDEAKAAVIGAHDDEGAGFYEWRFINECDAGWSPFCDRFPRADWMQWPEE